MRANASHSLPELEDSSLELDRSRQDSQVYLKAPSAPPEASELPPPDAELPNDFVAFLGEQQGLDGAAAFSLLCRLMAEYRTPQRREIAVLRRSA